MTVSIMLRGIKEAFKEMPETFSFQNGNRQTRMPRGFQSPELKSQPRKKNQQEKNGREIGRSRKQKLECIDLREKYPMADGVPRIAIPRDP